MYWLSLALLGQVSHHRPPGNVDQWKRQIDNRPGQAPTPSEGQERKKSSCLLNPAFFVLEVSEQVMSVKGKENGYLLKSLAWVLIHQGVLHTEDLFCKSFLGVLILFFF